MSILAQANPVTTAPVPVNPDDPTASLTLAALTIGLGLALAWAAGVFRRGHLPGPERLPPGRPAWPLVVVLGVGLFVWFGTQVAYGTYKQTELLRTEGPAARFDATNLGPADYAFLATVPTAAAFVAMLVGNAAIGGGTWGRLGFALGQLAPGFLRGAAGFLIVMPLMAGVSVLLELLYRRVGFQHPEAHELLEILDDSADPAVQWLIIGGAVVVAPLFEELVFRGHLQTLLRRGLWRLGAPRQPGPPGLPQPGGPYALPGTPPVPAHGPVALPALSPPGGMAAPVALVPAEMFAAPVPPLHPPPQPLPYSDPATPLARPAAWPAWGAIVLTSVAFSMVHAMWTWPLIFALSICLGYAYERTGNLWVTVALHALFNGFQTFLFLYLLRNGGPGI